MEQSFLVHHTLSCFRFLFQEEDQMCCLVQVALMCSVVCEVAMSEFKVENSSSTAGNYTFAAVKGTENYLLLQTSILTAFSKTQELKFVEGIKSCILSLVVIWRYDLLIAIRWMDTVRLWKIYWIAQYLLLIMGMNEAHSMYACLWCTISSRDRYRNRNTDVHVL